MSQRVRRIALHKQCDEATTSLPPPILPSLKEKLSASAFNLARFNKINHLQLDVVGVNIIYSKQTINIR